jgi:hypothetical protein
VFLNTTRPSNQASADFGPQKRFSEILLVFNKAEQTAQRETANRKHRDRHIVQLRKRSVVKLRRVCVPGPDAPRDHKNTPRWIRRGNSAPTSALGRTGGQGIAKERSVSRQRQDNGCCRGRGQTCHCCTCRQTCPGNHGTRTQNLDTTSCASRHWQMRRQRPRAAAGREHSTRNRFLSRTRGHLSGYTLHPLSGPSCGGFFESLEHSSQQW